MEQGLARGWVRFLAAEEVQGLAQRQAGAGLLTQIFTRGKQVKVPAETTMRFRLDRTLVLKLKA